MHVVPLLLALIAQRPDSFTAGVREYITVDTSLVALTHVLLVDGTGAAPKSDQTIVIRAGKIAAVGPAAAVQVPAGARVMDMKGSTVIPGMASCFTRKLGRKKLWITSIERTWTRTDRSWGR